MVGLHAPAETIGSHQCISVQWHPMLIDNNVGQSVLITHLKGAELQSVLITHLKGAELQSVLITHLKGAELRRRMLGHGP